MKISSVTILEHTEFIQLGLKRVDEKSLERKRLINSAYQNFKNFESPLHLRKEVGLITGHV